MNDEGISWYSVIIGIVLGSLLYAIIKIFFTA